MDIQNALKLFVPGLLGLLAPLLAKHNIILPADTSDQILAAIQGCSVAVSGFLVNGGNKDFKTTLTGAIGGIATFLASVGFEMSLETQTSLIALILTGVGFFTHHTENVTAQ